MYELWSLAMLVVHRPQGWTISFEPRSSTSLDNTEKYSIECYETICGSQILAGIRVYLAYQSLVQNCLICASDGLQEGW